MKKALCGLPFLLLCMSGAFAGEETAATIRQDDLTHMVACEPFSNSDGTRVLLTFAATKEKCGTWQRGKLPIVIDYREFGGVLIDYRGAGLTKYADLSQEGKALVDRLRRYLTKPTHFCQPVTDRDLFLVESAPAGERNGCSEAISTLRRYNRLSGTVNYHDGKGAYLGSLTLPEGRFEAALEEALSRGQPPLPVRRPTPVAVSRR